MPSQIIPLQDVAGSSQIAAVGYDDASGTLAIRFKNGKATYHYRDVQPHIPEQMLAADSIGKFVNDQVKGVYDHEKIPDEEEPS